MDLTGIFTNHQPQDKAHWGEALGLWNIGRFKALGITISEIFLAQAKDVELKNS